MVFTERLLYANLCYCNEENTNLVPAELTRTRDTLMCSPARVSKKGNRAAQSTFVNSCLGQREGHSATSHELDCQHSACSRRGQMRRRRPRVASLRAARCCDARPRPLHLSQWPRPLERSAQAPQPGSCSTLNAAQPAALPAGSGAELSRRSPGRRSR